MSPNKTVFSNPPINSKNLPLDARIYVAGHNGMVGSAILRYLQNSGYTNMITRTHSELDLTVQRAVADFFKDERMDAVVLAAAKVGGINANNEYPAEFIYQNLMIQNNVIHAAFQAGVERLLFLGSSCIYPKLAPQPMHEEYLLTGHLEPTNEPYAIAKIAGIKMCESYNRQFGTRYRCVMPTNLYGPNDNFDLETSHVLAAMIRKFHLARLAVEGDWSGIGEDQNRFGPIPDDIHASLKALSDPGPPDSAVVPSALRLWGSGNARRELLHVDDMAAACVFMMNLHDDQYKQARKFTDTTQSSKTAGPNTLSFFNVGSGQDLTIKELAELVKSAIGYDGEVFWDHSKPDGAPQKLLDVSRLDNLGWRPKINLQEGIRQTYGWYLGQVG
jgi:GDP-L-fucose synthase